ncbi:MAG TPA: hypothetical protein VEG31_00455 [Thermoproteota archaeon]|nr:hypothetical protein [Thermoproteota archaeon]
MPSDIVPYDQVLRAILREYEGRPKGWHILVAKAQGLGHDVYVFRPEGTMAVLKIESLSVPNPIGVGIESTDSHEAIRDMAERGSYPFGFRPISPSVLDRIVRNASAGQSPTSELLGDLMRQEPIPVRSATTPLVLEGPVVRFPSTLPTSYSTQSQRDLDIALRWELEKLVRRRYGEPYTR